MGGSGSLHTNFSLNMAVEIPGKLCVPPPPLLPAHASPRSLAALALALALALADGALAADPAAVSAAAARGATALVPRALAADVVQQRHHHHPH